MVPSCGSARTTNVRSLTPLNGLATVHQCCEPVTLARGQLSLVWATLACPKPEALLQQEVVGTRLTVSIRERE